MSREAVRELQERRKGHEEAIGKIDAVLKLLGANGARRGTRKRGKGPSKAQLAGLAKARAVRAAKSRPRKRAGKAGMASVNSPSARPGASLAVSSE